jgi:hypothetical glycosyl hydrolase
MRYDLGKGMNENWIIGEKKFNVEHLAKCEAIMSLGNGYLGLRSVTEEKYLGEVRNLFIAGTFNKFDEFEVTELPNAADITEMDIRINGKRFSLEKGTVSKYERGLNLKNGELHRSFTWINAKGEEFEFNFRRFVSLDNLHLIGMKVEIKPVNCKAEIIIGTGINAQYSNTGSQHFHEGEKRFYDKKYMELIQTTTESKIDFIFNTTTNTFIDDNPVEADSKMMIKRRKIFEVKTINLSAGEKYTLEKFVLVHTTRDLEYSSRDSKYDGKYSSEELKNEIIFEIREKSLVEIKNVEKIGYDELLNISTSKWAEKWNDLDIKIESENDFDQLAIRFSHYHLIIMTPFHDSRYGIAAKGLSGEGYKGHSFWDTEIFILPFFTYSDPAAARNLLKYRYKTLGGAREKAKKNGYEGAQYCWETAWITDGETTPVWGDVDVMTGKATKIWSGFIEQHISSDISYAVWQYYKITNDQDFMDRYGYEIILDTATFWTSRLEWEEENNRYGIHGVIGGDEYKEHVDNNAFTNYMAHWNIEMAIEYYKVLESEKPEVFTRLNKELNLKENYKKWCEKVEKIYLPLSREDGVIPQDDTYLQKEIIDLTKYKNQTHVGSMFDDYSLDQVNEIQVTKQADIMILMYLLENKFGTEVKSANFDYYEPKTLHDSSLSFSTHCILASDIKNSELAYSLFEKAAKIDLGLNMKSSDMGIHTASIGGIWQSVVCGFGGVRMLGGELRIDSRLPKEWKNLEFPINWKGDRLEVQVTKTEIKIENTTKINSEIEIEVHGRKYMLTDKLNIKLGTDKLDNIEAFIFDLDGVITDTAEYHYKAWKDLADKYDLYFDRDLNEALRGVSRLDSIQLILDHNGSDIENETKIKWSNEKNDIYVQLIENITPEDLLPGVESLLKDLKDRDIRIALGSASKNARAVIEKLEIKDYFEVIGDGHSVQNSKPAPDIFIYAANELKVKVENCVVVEDAEAGVQAAISANMKTIGIGDENRVGKANFVFESPEYIKLKNILK